MKLVHDTVHRSLGFTWLRLDDCTIDCLEGLSVEHMQPRKSELIQRFRKFLSRVFVAVQNSRKRKQFEKCWIMSQMILRLSISSQFTHKTCCWSIKPKPWRKQAGKTVSECSMASTWFNTSTSRPTTHTTAYAI